MDMADHRGGVRGTVRNASGAAVADTAITATNSETGAQFTATTDAQGAYSLANLPPGKYELSIVSPAGLTTFRRTGVEVVADRTEPLDIAITAATAAQAAEFERQQLLERIATLEQRITDLESSAVLSEPETRVRRVEVFVDPSDAVHRRRAREQSDAGPVEQRHRGGSRVRPEDRASFQVRVPAEQR
jgi:hypothetical protein